MSSGENEENTTIVNKGDEKQQLTASRIVFTDYVQQPKPDAMLSAMQRRFSNVKVYDLKEEETDTESEANVSVRSRGSNVTGSSTHSSNRFRHTSRETFLHPVEVERLIPSFNGKEGGCSRWITKIEGYAAVYGWSPRACLHYAHSRLTGTARKWFDAQDEVTLNWECFKTSICEAFPSRVNEADVHFQLARRVRGKDEDEESYVYEMQRIAKEGRLSEEAIIAYIIRNINDDKLQEYLMSKDLHLVRELVSCLQRFLRMRAVVNTRPCVKQDPVKHHPVRNNDRKETAIVEDAVRQPLVRRCFNCNEMGHLSSHCPLPQRKPRCSRCGKVGHAEYDCSHAAATAPRPTIESRQVRFMQGDEQEGSKTAETKLYYLEVDEGSRTPTTVLFNKSCQPFNALVDLGSPVSLIKASKLPSDFDYSSNVPPNEIIGINGTRLMMLGSFRALIIVGSRVFVVNLIVVPNDTISNEVNVLLGRDFTNGNGITGIVFKRRAMVSGYDPRLMIEAFGNCDDRLCVLVEDKENLDLDVGDTDDTARLKTTVEKVFQNCYVDRPKPSEPSVKMEVEIKLREHVPFTVSPARLSVFEKLELNKIIEEMLDKGIIRKSQSNDYCRVVLVKKRNNTFRMCVNFKPLNRLVERDNFPMPVIEDLVIKLRDKRYFSSLDLKNGFYHVDIAENSKKYTSFVVDGGQYEFNKLPFGFANSPAAFVRYINKVLEKLITSGKITVFIDDILISTETIEEHLDILSAVLSTLSDNHVKLQLQKCSFLKTTIDYLGYNITYNLIRPSDRHIDSVQSIPIPVNVHALHRFIGLVSYFRKFIRNFNHLAQPLYELLKKDVPFRFEEEHVTAFNNLKDCLIQKPVLAIYSPSLETEVHTDASSAGFGGILLQRQENDKKFHPVLFYTRKTTAAESKLHSFELETLAVVYTLQRFRMYLFGLKFVIVTDCEAMKKTLDKRDVNAKISRWSLYLEQFDYTIVHRPGDRMRHVDALSRVNILLLEPEEDPKDVFTNSIYVAQLQDTDIQKIKTAVLLGSRKDYEVRDNIVYKKEKKNKLLLCVPKHMEPSVIFRYHNDMGHFGADKVCAEIRRIFWFPEMKKKVLDHGKTCVTCISFNPRDKQHDGYLQSIDKGTVPFDTVHVDHLGPLEMTKGKNVHIFAVIDGFSKFIKLYATRSTRTCEVLKSLRLYISYYSKPRRIISDRGTAFTSKEFKSFCAIRGIEHVLIATGCPKANGQIERYNRTLVPLLAKLVEERKMSWDNVLFEAEYLLNNSYNRSIDNSPAVLLFGVRQRNHVESDLERYLQNLNEQADRDLEKIRNDAVGKIKQLQEYNKTKYDAKCKRNTSYKEGDLVAIRTVKVAGENSKLKAKYRGPYLIKKVLDNNRYIVTDLEGYQVTSTYFDGTFDPLNLRMYAKAATRGAESLSSSSTSEDSCFEGFSDESDFHGFPEEE